MQPDTDEGEKETQFPQPVDDALDVMKDPEFNTAQQAQALLTATHKCGAGSGDYDGPADPDRGSTQSPPL